MSLKKEIKKDHQHTDRHRNTEKKSTSSRNRIKITQENVLEECFENDALYEAEIEEMKKKNEELAKQMDERRLIRNLQENTRKARQQ